MGNRMTVLGLLLIVLFGGSPQAAKMARNIGVPTTGQTECYSAGQTVDCQGTGQDGELQKGISTGAWSRFKDNGNGTVTDNLTGLVWLQNANCWGLMKWGLALDASQWLTDGTCGLWSGASQGGWRTPNVRELQNLMDYGQYFPSLPEGHPFNNVQTDYYWTNTTLDSYPGYAWQVDFGHGYVGIDFKSTYRFWLPVRDAKPDGK